MHPVVEQIVKQSPHLSWMERGCLYLTLHGSRAFGTNTDTSDYDYKGFAIPPSKYYHGFQHVFEQAELHNPDVVIYELTKFFSLASMSNPSIIEVLFTDEKDHQYVSPLAEEILANRDKFLSKRVRFTFSGYAISQLKRIKLHRRYFLNPPSALPTRKDFGLPERTLLPPDQLMAAEADIQKELNRFNFDFVGELSEPMKILVRSNMAEMLAELKLSSEDQWMYAAKKVGLDDNFIQIMQRERAYKNIKTEWDNYQNWKKNRNPERAELERKYGYDCKNAYQLVRLLRMAKEIMTTAKVIVKRPDWEELLAIRNGAWEYDRLVEFAEKEDAALEEIYKTTNVLPKIPNINFLDSLCVKIIEASLR